LLPRNLCNLLFTLLPVTDSLPSLCY